MTQRDYELGHAELDVLKVLWNGPRAGLPVRTVMNALHERGRRVAYTTVQTILTRLEQKGFVASDKTGPAFIYKAAVRKADVFRSRTRTLLDQLYDGAAGPLVLQLVRSRRLTPGELAELQRLIEELDLPDPN
ncbi:MAG: BlaI/MecI/CopY family transcriptional regulator [Planctomycetota bacterium]|nr:MAG: BlaI/MecI/CopY family transcriptional regulator [Planctomycetota bacterium]